MNGQLSMGIMRKRQKMQGEEDDKSMKHARMHASKVGIGKTKKKNIYYVYNAEEMNIKVNVTLVAAVDDLLALMHWHLIQQFILDIHVCS